MDGPGVGSGGVGIGNNDMNLQAAAPDSVPVNELVRE
jgi:hypothetical protein